MIHADLSLQNRNQWLGEVQPLPMLVISSVALLVLGVVMISPTSLHLTAAPISTRSHSWNHLTT